MAKEEKFVLNVSLEITDDIIEKISDRAIEKMSKPGSEIDTARINYNTGQIAKMLNTNRKNIERHAREGLIPGAKKIGKSWNIPHESYLKYSQNIPNE